MMARRCAEIQDELAWAGLEGGAHSASAEEHLRACPDCRRARARLEEILGGLGADPIPDPGQDYWNTFALRLRTRIATREVPEVPRLAWPRIWALAATAATFFILGVAVGGWEAPAELEATVRLNRLAVGSDPERLRQVLDLFAPDLESDFAGEGEDNLPISAADMEDALEEVFPEDAPGVYESAGELTAEQRQRLAQALDQGWV